jgi:hypothetical protein
MSFNKNRLEMVFALQNWSWVLFNSDSESSLGLFSKNANVLANQLKINEFLFNSDSEKIFLSSEIEIKN